MVSEVKITPHDAWRFTTQRKAAGQSIMEIPISDHSMVLRYGADIYICANGADDGDVRISVVVGGCSLNVDMSIDELQQFRSMIGDVINEAFKVQPELRCPACGYTFEKAKLHGDHNICRRFPFFPGERGKTQAIG